MGMEIQGEKNEYEWRTLKHQTVEKTDPAWYVTGINKLIHRYEKRLTRYGGYVEKWIITWGI